jgi:hypothetical protein
MRFIKDIYVALFGAGTSLATAWLLAFIETHFNIAVYTYCFFFIIPLGAFAAGIMAAGGYYLGAKLVGHRPGPLLLLTMLLVSGATFFAVHYLVYDQLRAAGCVVYYQVEQNGWSLQDLSFFHYLDLNLRETTLVFFNKGSSVNTGPIGSWGYAMAALQVIGFTFGGLMVYIHLTELPYCFACSRYLRKRAKWVRYYRDPSELLNAVRLQSYHFERAELDEAIKTLLGSGHSRPKGAEAEATLQLRRCRGCGYHRLDFTARRKVINDWREVPELSMNCVESDDLTPLEAEVISYSKE